MPSAPKHTLKGPFKAARLCLLSVILPGALVATALYMRYHVYSEEMLPIGASDMRLLDGKMSTTWCQGQMVKANTTFNAFLLPQTPSTDPEPLMLTMTRVITLEDDMKEYWGFYLLAGSQINISTCSRWPGGSLLVVKGHSQLKKCAYIGDDSSEELDEMEDLKKGVVTTTEGSIIVNDESDELRNKFEHDIEEISLVNQVLMEVHTTTTQVPKVSSEQVEGVESRNSTEDSEEVLEQLVRKIKKMGNRGTSVLRRLNERLKSERKDKVKEQKRLRQEDSSNDSSFVGTKRTSTDDPDSVLLKIIRQFIQESRQEERKRRRKNKDRHAIRHEKTKLDKKMVSGSYEENLTEEKSEQYQEVEHHKSSGSFKRFEREVSEDTEELIDEISQPELEDNNVAAEDEDLDIWDLMGDGIADHRGLFNQTTANDTSNEEFWSSFSSSEEALQKCEGVISILQLPARPKCQNEITDEDVLSYTVPSNGYYYFVFSSENEIQPNLIRIRFDISKIVYNVSNPKATCHNSTDCAFSLDFFSSEMVVMELPVENNMLWNEEYVVVSTCEPRTAIYLGLVIAVPLIILVFAFQ